MRILDCDISYKDFGEDLLATFDLDPLYPTLVRAGMDDAMLKRWLLAYWCYYSAGTASYIAEAPSKYFYKKMMEHVDTYPRGHERRHFRAASALRGIEGLKVHGAPEGIVDNMIDGDTFQDISRRVQSYTQFGPWIAWKIADMAERVLQRPVDFADAELGVYRDPVKGAALVWYGDQKHDISMDVLYKVIDESLSMFSGYLAPPYLDRPINIQEVETILCKYKSHYNKHYPMGNDSFEIYDGLEGWGDLAEHLKDCLVDSSSYFVRRPGNIVLKVESMAMS